MAGVQFYGGGKVAAINREGEGGGAALSLFSTSELEWEHVRRPAPSPTSPHSLIYVVPWSEFPIVPSYPHYPHWLSPHHIAPSCAHTQPLVKTVHRGRDRERERERERETSRPHSTFNWVRQVGTCSEAGGRRSLEQASLQRAPEPPVLAPRPCTLDPQPSTPNPEP